MSAVKQTPQAERHRGKPARFNRGPGQSVARYVRGVIVRYALLLLVLIIAIGPFVWQVSTSLKGPLENVSAMPPQFIPQDPTFANYRSVGETIPLFRYLMNSTIVAGAVMVGNCLFASMAGYALARMRFKGRNSLFALMIASMIIPFEVIMISVFMVARDLGLVNTLAGVALPSLVGILSIFIMRQGFLSLSKEVEEAAYIDGAGDWRTFWRIGLPSVKGSMAVVAILSFMNGWDDFLWPLIILRDPEVFTLTVGLVFLENAFTADQRLVAAGTIIAILPVLVLFAVFQKHFFKGVGHSAVKG